MFSWNYCRQVNRNDKNSWVQMTLEEHHRNSQFESPLFEVCELWNGKINNRWDRRRHFSSVQPYRNPLFAIVFSSTKKQHFISRFSLHFRDPCILTLQCFFFPEVPPLTASHGTLDIQHKGCLPLQSKVTCYIPQYPFGPSWSKYR